MSSGSSRFSDAGSNAVDEWQGDPRAGVPSPYVELPTIRMAATERPQIGMSV